MKKFKLFASLSTLCLCIAVLCMGIYAAQTAYYTISGTTSYTVSDVFATISAKVFKVSGQQDASTMKTNVNTLATTALGSIDAATYLDAGITIADFDTESSDSADRSVSITIDSTYMTYYLVINIANNADVKLNAQLTDSTSYSANNLNTAGVYIQNGIEKDTTKNLVVAFSLKDKKVSISSLTINYSIEVGYTEYEVLALKQDAANSYWYTELGTLSDGTAIRWRVVSLDGTTKYTYSSTKPEIGTGTIFLQETYLGSKPAFDTSNSNNYYNSSIRTTINTLSTWNLTDSDVLSLITKRNITGIEAYDVDGTYKYESTTSDYFWLLSDDEADTYLGTGDADRIWKPDNVEWEADWWLRSPVSVNSNDVYFITSGGTFYNHSANDTGYKAVRAAFQLA